MAKELWVVERWLNYLGDEPAYEGVFCFDSEHVAQAFVDKMKRERPKELFMMFLHDVFIHAEDAVAAAKGE